MLAVLKQLVITGGSGGLGTAVREKFTSTGWDVVSLGKADLDLMDKDAIRGFFEGKEVDLLICAAGAINDKPLIKTTEDDWVELYGINFQAARESAMAVLPCMCRKGKGHVVFVSSFSASYPPPGQIAYATAKAALLGLSIDLADRFGKNGIRVNAILPGFLETRMTSMVSNERRIDVLRQHFLGSFNTPEAVAGFLYFLEEGMPFTSGQVFQLDSRGRI